MSSYFLQETSYLKPKWQPGSGNKDNRKIYSWTVITKVLCGYMIPHQGLRIPGTGFQSLSIKHKYFWITILSGIPECLSLIPDSKAQYSGFHKQNFTKFRNLDSFYIWTTSRRDLHQSESQTSSIHVKNKSLLFQGLFRCCLLFKET